MRNRGSVLLVFLVMATLFVLLIGIGTNLAVGGYRRTTSVAWRNQAYYLAEAGVEEALRELRERGCREISSSATDFLSPSPIGKYEYQVSIPSPSPRPNEARIVAKGTVNEKQVILEVCTSCSPISPIDLAVFASNSLILDGRGPQVKITGSIGVNPEGSIDISGNVEIDGIVFVDPDNFSASGNLTYNLETPEKRDYPLPPFPNYPDLPTPTPNSLTVGNNQQVIISDNYYYSTIKIEKGGTLIIDTGTSGSERIIRVRTLEIGDSGRITIQGSGKAVIYVEDGLDFGKDSKVNEGGNVLSLSLYYKGTEGVIFQGSASLMGVFYNKQALLKLQGGTQDRIHLGIVITGTENILTDVTIYGGPLITSYLLYAPFANVEMKGGSSFTGAIVSNTFKLSGGGSVTFSPLFYFVKDYFEGLFDPNISKYKPRKILSWKEI